MKKIERGQFYTLKNVFDHSLFYQWYDLIPNVEHQTFLEPFAGENNIVKMIKDLNILQPSEWHCFDIDPGVFNHANEFPIKPKDTISNFPEGYNVVITNPPYLAKNSATRKGLEFPDDRFDDLYKVSLNLMLKHSSFIAAIIPASFLTQDQFKERLFGVITIQEKVFEDTEFPVCLALFTPEETKDFYIYSDEVFLGFETDILKNNPLVKSPTGDRGWVFNDPDGHIGFCAVDNNHEESIGFCHGDEIPAHKVKKTSRYNTRISGGNLKACETESFINELNAFINSYRKQTSDVYLTPYRGLRKDGKYRRRLSYTEARNIMNYVYYEVFIKKNSFM